jgi:hypothetical protein
MKDEEGYYKDLYSEKVAELSEGQKKLFESICAREVLEMQIGDRDIEINQLKDITNLNLETIGELSRKITSLERDIENSKLVFKDQNDYIEETKKLIDLERVDHNKLKSRFIELDFEFNMLRSKKNIEDDKI